MSSLLNHAARVLAVLTSATFIAATVIATPACGGCPDKAKNFAVTPADDCLHPSADQCGATLGTLTLQNDCTTAVTVAATQDGTAASSDAGDAGATTSTTIAPGTSAEVNVPAGVGHVHVTGTLGATPIVIDYDVSG